MSTLSIPQAVLVLDRRVRKRRLGVLSTGILVEGRRPWPRDLPEERSAVPKYLHQLDGAAVQSNPYARARAIAPVLTIGVWKIRTAVGYTAAG